MKRLLMILFSLLGVFGLYYFMLPPLNLRAPAFWTFLVVCIVVVIAIITGFSYGSRIIVTKRNNKIPDKKYLGIFIGIACIPLLIILVNIFNTPLFRADAYYKRIEVTASDFNKDVDLVNFDSLALLDKDSSQKLGDKVMGQMTDLVSQFEVSDLYTQINYQDQIVRVTPLEYANVIKYFTNRSKGVEGYITVNSVTGEANLVRLDKGMKYVPSGLFWENLARKLRFSYPTTIFGEVNFEVDDEGNPYWIAETIKYSGVGLKREVSGVVILNPIDGTSKKYKLEEIPTWVDHVYSADLIMEQLDDWGAYKNGFFNAIFGQKEVMRTTDGYNYMAMNDDVYMYTGITSVSNDASNIGFILTNLRTKETHFYDVAGAIETAAMASAEGQVQQMSYTSTFPLLINLNNKPTYLVSLKDNAGLVKMYAFIDYTDYQKVKVTDASLGILAAANNYLGREVSSNEDILEKEITIRDITSGVISGNTYYYIRTDDEVFKAALKIREDLLPFLVVGDKITIEYYDGEIKEIIKITS